jgi:drug/metabolite transporter (DMT)-like permease
VLAAVFTAIVNVLVRSLKSLHPNLIVHNFAVITALLCIPAVPIVGEAVVHPRRLIWSDWLLLVGIGGTGFMGQMCITRGLQLEKAGLASMIRTLDVVLAFAMHLAFLHDEQLAWYTVVGSLLIVACSIYVAIRKFRQARARVRESSSARLGA